MTYCPHIIHENLKFEAMMPNSNSYSLKHGVIPLSSSHTKFEIVLPNENRYTVKCELYEILPDHQQKQHQHQRRHHRINTYYMKFEASIQKFKKNGICNQPQWDWRGWKNL